MAETQQSIYEYMASNAGENGLPDGFALMPEPGDGGPLQWADGARDGIYFYHTPPRKLTAEEEQELTGLLRTVSAGKTGEADRQLELLTGKVQAAALMESLLETVVSLQEELSAPDLYRYALHLMLESSRRESVKTGLILMRLFDSSEEALKDLIRSLALSDEFTLYSLQNMLGWDRANEEIFDLIRHVRGWGRIHALEQLEPADDRIRRWILREGINNTVMPAYSALTAFEKSGAEELLRSGQCSAEDFTALGAILSALLEEGPVTGISGLQDPEGVLRSYLAQAAGRELKAEDYETVSAIYYYAASRDALKQEQEGGTPGQLQGTALEAVKILRSPEAESRILAAVEEGRCVELAAALGLPYQRRLLTLMEQDFDKNCLFSRYMMKHPAYAEAVLDLYRRKIPWDNLEEDPRDELGLAPAFEVYRRLDSLLGGMDGDCRTAGDILMKTLAAPVTRTRWLTLQNLEAWVQAAQEPLSALSPRIWAKLKEVCEKEPSEELKEKMRSLLEEPEDKGTK